MKLYINGTPAVKGQEVTTFRGEQYILVGWREPQHSGSTGRVYIRNENGEREFFPSVVDGRFEEDTI